MTTWEELLKGRTQIMPVVNSAHMLKCIEEVTAKWPDAKIEKTGDQSWRLVSKDEALSNEHNSHYACWAEARGLMNVTD